MKFIATVITLADMAAVAFVEKWLIAGHTPLKELIVVGIVFGLPALLILLVILLAAWLTALGKATAASPAPRAGYAPGQFRGRR